LALLALGKGLQQNAHHKFSRSERAELHWQLKA